MDHVPKFPLVFDPRGATTPDIPPPPRFGCPMHVERAKLLALVLAFVQSALLCGAHPTHPGCSPLGPLPGHGPAAPGTGGYTLTLSPGPDANSPLTLTLQGPPFKGFLITATTGVSLSVPPASQGVAQTACGGVGHNSPVVKDSVTAHLAVTGPATLTFYVVQSGYTWFGPQTLHLPTQ